VTTFGAKKPRSQEFKKPRIQESPALRWFDAAESLAIRSGRLLNS
jgi:hypothetical protein